MTRYFFAFFIALVILPLNSAVLSESLRGAILIVPLLAINTFSLSLILFWLGCYSRVPSKPKYLILGRAALYLSGGLGFIAIGYHAIDAKSFLFHLNDGQSENLIYQAGLWATENDYCQWLGAGLIVFGIFMTWPSSKLFIGMQAKGA